MEVTDRLSYNNCSCLLKVVILLFAVPLLHYISASYTSWHSNRALALIDCLGYPSNILSLALSNEVLVIVLRSVPVRQVFCPFLCVPGQGF